jgi:hypothetical protein
MVVDRLLADSRVDPSAKNNEAIIMASRLGRSATVNSLLADLRVDPTAKNNEAIQWASHIGHHAVAELLLTDIRVATTYNGPASVAKAGVAVCRNLRFKQELLSKSSCSYINAV